MTLYEIDQSLLDLVDPETGEVLEFEAFCQLQMAKEQKMENLALWIKDLNADAEKIAQEEARLKQRRTVMERKAARLKDYLMRFLDGGKFETPRCKVSTRSSAYLDVADTATAAAWLVQHGHVDLVTRSVSLDKRAVTALLKEGAAIPGAQLSQRESVVIK